MVTVKLSPINAQYAEELHTDQGSASVSYTYCNNDQKYYVSLGFRKVSGAEAFLLKLDTEKINGDVELLADVDCEVSGWYVTHAPTRLTKGALKIMQAAVSMTTQSTKAEQHKVTLKFTVATYIREPAMPVRKLADMYALDWSVEPLGTDVAYTVGFLTAGAAEAFMLKLGLKDLRSVITVTADAHVRVFGHQVGPSLSLDLSISNLEKRQVCVVDWTKPLKHLGGLQVRYVETLVARVRFKHLCVIGTENQYAALFDDQGQPEVGPFAVTNAPVVETLRVGVTRVGHSVGLTGPQNLALTGPQNLALTWQGDKLIKAEVL